MIIIDHKEKSAEILGACFDERFKIEIAQELQDLKELAKNIKSDFIPKNPSKMEKLALIVTIASLKKSAILTRRNQKRRNFSSGVVAQLLYGVLGGFERVLPFKAD